MQFATNLYALFFLSFATTLTSFAESKPTQPQPFLPPPHTVTYSPEEFLQPDELDTATADGRKLQIKDWRKTISLDGQWCISGLKSSENDFSRNIGPMPDYLKPEFDDSKWDKIQVPLDWYMKYKTFRNTAKPYVTGCYRHTFELSEAELRGRSVFVNFKAIGGEGILYVNGKNAGSHLGNFIPREADISAYIKPGKNVLVLQVFADFGQQYGCKRPDRICRGAQFSINFIKGGLWQSVSLELRSNPAVNRLLITPLYNDKKIRVDYELYNPGAPFRCIPGLSVSSALRKDQNDHAIAMDYPEIEVKTGQNTGTLYLPLPKVKSWSPESPYLYFATLYLRQGNQIVSAEARRFGFREFKTEGGKFLLNGQRIYLFGENLHAVYADGTGLTRTQERDRFLQHLKQYKENGYSIIRTAHQPTSSLLYEVADELGFMIYDEWAWSFITNVDRKLFPVNVEREMHEWVLRDYNHPSVVMWSCGNEVPSKDPFIKELLNRHAALVRQWDISGRPVSVFSGSGEWNAFGRGKMETDVVDLHCYWGLTSAHWTHWNDKLNEYYLVSAEDYGQKGNDRLKIPYIIWEAVGYSWGQHYDRDFKLDNIDAYARYVKTPYTWALSQGIGFSGTIGLAAALDPERGNKYAQALYGKRIIELIRQDERIQGIAPWFINPAQPEARIWNQPVFCGLRWGKQALPPRNLIGETPTELEIYWVNDTNIPWNNAVLNIDFVDKTEKVQPLSQITIPTVTPWQLATHRQSLSLPHNVQGWGQLRLRLFADGKEISRNYYNVFTTPKSTMNAAVNNHFRLGMWKSATNEKLRHIMNGLAVQYTEIDNVPQLESLNALIIPPGVTLSQKENANLMNYLARGGRIMIMESNAGPVPLIDSYTSIKAPTPFVDLAIPSHPVFRGLCQENFDTWNNPDYGNVITNAIAPFSVNALAVRGPIYGQTLIGNALMEGTLDKGRLICSQLNAIGLWGLDASATVYLRNLIEYFLDGQNDYSARELDLLGNRNFKVDADRIVKINLRPYANRDFKDDKADDRQGGWVDQGAKDFRHMPKGNQVLLDVPFEIIDPAQNRGRGALILGSDVRPYFPREIKGIAINGKFSRLYFLHTSAWTRSEKMGYYRLNYTDGTSVYQDLVGGKNIGDWCDCQDLSQARLGLVHENKDVAVADGFNQSGRIGLWIMEWANPFPEKEIASMDFVADGRAVPILIAVSGEKTNPDRLVIFRAGKKSRYSAGAWNGNNRTTIKEQSDSNPPAVNVNMPARQGSGIATATFWFDPVLLKSGTFKYLSLTIRTKTVNGAIDLVLPQKNWKNILHKTLFLRDCDNDWTQIRIPLKDMKLNANAPAIEELRGEFYFYNGLRHPLTMPISFDLREIALE